MESGKWREFHPTIPGPVLPIFPFAPVGNTEIPFFSSISEPVDHRQLLTGNYSFRTPTAGDGGESVWDIPMNDISHERAHCILHTLMYPYTNALAINTVYGESVAYRVGSTRTHTHTHTHTHTVSLSCSLSQGVNQHHGRWIARYSEAGQSINLGSFSTQKEAAEAWDVKARECGMRERRELEERAREREGERGGGGEREGETLCL